jgi:gamma-glutamylcyclotransferase (GGCT)/AIG2-like uncharacterized protein YtfP
MSQEFNNFGYVTKKPCVICNKVKDNRLHPLFDYAICIEHFKLNPQNILKLTKNNKKKEEIMKVAVYGTLRKGQRASYVLKNANYLGTFQSEPIYLMFTPSNTYPAIKEGGYTSVTFEVYDNIDKKTLSQLDGIEGYYSKNAVNNLYNRKHIDTPFGRAIIYVYNKEIPNNPAMIESGDWVEYFKKEIKFKETYD